MLVRLVTAEPRQELPVLPFLIHVFREGLSGTSLAPGVRALPRRAHCGGRAAGHWQPSAWPQPAETREGLGLQKVVASPPLMVKESLGPEGSSEPVVLAQDPEVVHCGWLL